MEVSEQTQTQGEAEKEEAEEEDENMKKILMMKQHLWIHEWQN